MEETQEVRDPFRSLGFLPVVIAWGIAPAVLTAILAVCLERSLTGADVEHDMRVRSTLLVASLLLSPAILFPWSMLLFRGKTGSGRVVRACILTGGMVLANVCIFHFLAAMLFPLLDS